jgi:hypothetical protein
MSSRTSSKISNSLTSSSNVIMNSMLITVIYNVLVIGYLLALEGRKCGCIRDWRHDFMKYYSGAIIVWSILFYYVAMSTKNQFAIIINNILMFAGLISLWCLYTYVGDLDKTQCKCAVEKQKNMHYFLYLWRYVPVILIILTLFGIIITTANSL